MKPELEQLESRDCPAPINPWTASPSVLAAAEQSASLEMLQIRYVAYWQTLGVGDYFAGADVTPPPASAAAITESPGWALGSLIQVGPQSPATPAVALPPVLDGPLAINQVQSPSHFVYIADTGDPAMVAVQTATPTPAHTLASPAKLVTLVTNADAGSARLGYIPPAGETSVDPVTGQLNEAPGATLVVSYSVGGSWVYQTSTDWGQSWSSPTPTSTTSLALATGTQTGDPIFDGANAALDAALTDVKGLS